MEVRHATLFLSRPFVTKAMRRIREFVQTTYKPPQISDEEEPEALAETYVGDFRRVFIEHPRVRLDGVYIAICHYVYVTNPNISLSITEYLSDEEDLVKVHGSKYEQSSSLLSE